MTTDTGEAISLGRAAVRLSVRTLGILLAAVSVLLSFVDVVRAIRPASLTGSGPIISFLSGLYPVVPALVCGLVGFLLGFGAKILSGSARRSKLQTASILLSILGIILSGAAFTATHLFPEGMIHDIPQTSQPFDDSSELMERINWAFGPCEKPWESLDSGQLTGINYMDGCPSSGTVFIAFTDPHSARSEAQAAAQTAAGFIRDTQGAKAETFASLRGDQWLVIGPQAGITKLHTLWGGRLGTAALVPAASY